MVLPAVKLKICPLYKYDFPSAYHGDAGFSDGTDGGNLKSATCQSREVAPEKTCLTQSDPEETELMVSSSDQHLLRPAPPAPEHSRSTVPKVTLPHKKEKKPRENNPAAERWSS